MMATWKEFTLEAVCSRITDGAHNSPPSVPEGRPMASVKDLTPFGIRLVSCRRIPEKDFEKLVLQGCQPVKGDVLIAKDGATALDTVCEVKRNDDVVLLSSVAILRPNPSVIDSSFLRHYLDSPATRSYLKGSFISGAAIPRVVLKDLKRALVRIPPLPVQRRIAGILSAYDELMENCHRRVRILEAIARTLYREWFTLFRYPGHEKVPRVASPLGHIPKGWEVKTIADTCESINYGYTASAVREEVGPRFLRITDIVPDVIDWAGVPFCKIPEDKAPKYLLKHGDIVVARTGATTGYAKRLNKLHPRTVFASYLVRARAKATFSNLMLGILMESDEYKQFVKANIGGAAQPQANAVVLTSMRVVLPPPSIGQKFDHLVEPMIDEAELLAVKIQNLRRTRELLLPRLLSGQVNLKAN